MTYDIRTFGDYACKFEPPLDTRTEGLDLVDAVALQHNINVSLDLGDGYFTNPFILNQRERTENKVGTFLFYVIDGGNPNQQHTKEDKVLVLQKYLGDMTGREVTIAHTGLSHKLAVE